MANIGIDLTDDAIRAMEDRALLELTARGVIAANSHLTSQNGRIKSLEDWRNVLAGGLCVVTFLVPVTMFIASRL